MKDYRRKIAICFVTIVSTGMIHTAGLASEVGQLRGHRLVSKLIESRLLTSKDTFWIGIYLESNPTLTRTMGGYDSNEIPHKFRNGTPNALNMTLYYLAFDQMSDELSRVCLGAVPGHLPLKPSVQSVFAALCAWPSGNTMSDDVLRPLWRATMGFAIADKHYQAWKSYAHQHLSGMSGQSALKALLHQLLLHPSILLTE